MALSSQTNFFFQDLLEEERKRAEDLQFRLEEEQILRSGEYCLSLEFFVFRFLTYKIKYLVLSSLYYIK